MKKLFVYIILTFISGTAYTQFLPEKGSTSIEYQYYPVKTTIPVNGLQFRWFFKKDRALSLKFGLNGDNFTETNPFKDTSGNEIPGSANHSKSFYLINLGYEMHRTPFIAGNRLSIHSRFEIGFGQNIVHSFYEEKNGNTSIDVHRALYDFGSQNITERAFWVFQFSVYTGFDFYIYHGLYIGMDLGMTIPIVHTQDYTIDTKTNGTKSNFTSSNKIEHSKIEYAAYPVFHLGWRF